MCTSANLHQPDETTEADRPRFISALAGGGGFTGAILGGGWALALQRERTIVPEMPPK
jgi:hypothetical protein